MTKSLLNDLRKIKNEIHAHQLKCVNLKTRKAKEKRWDKIRELRVQFRNLEDNIDWSKFNIAQLNLMAPYAGPIHLADAENFKHEGRYFSFNFKNDETRYVGEYCLIKDKCGIDNLAILEKQIA